MNLPKLSSEYFPFLINEDIYFIKYEEKRIFLYFDLPIDSTLSDADKDLLKKILRSINVKNNETESVFGNKLSGSDFDLLMSERKILYLIIFSENNQIFSTITEHYKFQYHKETKIILSNSLKELQKNQSLKMKLWESLRKEFIKTSNS